MIEAVLFDIGNVLLNFDYQRTVRSLSEHTGVSPEDLAKVLEDLHFAHETGELSQLGYFEEVARRTGFAESEEVFHKAFSDIFTPNEPMWELVRPLFGKVPVYLFSNTSARHEQWIFEKYPEMSQFDGSFFSWRLGCMKPDREYYRKSLSTLPFPPEKIAYFDDLEPNILQGREWGLQAITYRSDNHAGFLEEVRKRGLFS